MLRDTKSGMNRMIASRIPFRRNYQLQAMVSLYIVFWIATAISPTDRLQWALENLLPIGTIILLVVTFNKFPFTNLSYLFIFFFLILHTYAAHYTYQSTPFDIWLKNTFHTKRSYFDRVVHFSFGLLWTYPTWELLNRVAKLGRFFSFALPVSIVFSLSSLFEIVEMLVAIVAGKAGADYMGLQGDIFDSQKDMALGLMGAVVSMGTLGILIRRKK
ncbi:DUF2238 domain-containing protein [Brevibacillus nitrificans]|uniref:DUF2238 domain-containing protein n=1 Tax=Brevibacillus nitrificans TaxID=651560 RepID=UPI002605A1F7|nr:DUF2238 domain-containing protein [Brevibacillus nitrificans]